MRCHKLSGKLCNVFIVSVFQKKTVDQQHADSKVRSGPSLKLHLSSHWNLTWGYRR